MFWSTGNADFFNVSTPFLLRLKKQELGGLRQMLNAVFKELTILGSAAMFLSFCETLYAASLHSCSSRQYEVTRSHPSGGERYRTCACRRVGSEDQ